MSGDVEGPRSTDGDSMRSWIEDIDEQVADPSHEDIHRFVVSGRPFWLHTYCTPNFLLLGRRGWR